MAVSGSQIVKQRDDPFYRARVNFRPACVRSDSLWHIQMTAYLLAKQTARRRHGPSGIRILIFHHLIKHHA